MGALRLGAIAAATILTLGSGLGGVSAAAAQTAVLAPAELIHVAPSGRDQALDVEPKAAGEEPLLIQAQYYHHHRFFHRHWRRPYWHHRFWRRHYYGRRPY